LQHSIAFFRLPDAEPALAPRPLARRPAPAPAKRTAIKGTKTARLLTPRAGTLIDHASRMHGFTLDLTAGGPDPEDAEFSRTG